MVRKSSALENGFEKVRSIESPNYKISQWMLPMRAAILVRKNKGELASEVVIQDIQIRGIIG